MTEPSRLTSSVVKQSATVARVVAVAERQWGVLSWAQLRSCGLSDGGISRWIAVGRVHRVHPGVYALGHRVLRVQGQLMGALLYAGAGATLSHVTAAWWWELIDGAPTTIEVSAPGRRGPTQGIYVHHPRALIGGEHRRLPVTTVARTLLDLAATAPTPRLRRALAEADYRRLLDYENVKAVLGRGHPGSAALRRALGQHLPELACTRSALEEAFLALCEAGGIELPIVNARVCGLTVDALWLEQRVIVELDGAAAHGTRAQFERDRERDLMLRAVGYLVLRYTWRQIIHRPERVLADLGAALVRPALTAPHHPAPR